MAKTGPILQPIGGTTGGSAPLPETPVSGSSDSNEAVFGQTNTGVGVRGVAWHGPGIGTGVSGESNNQGIGVLDIVRAVQHCSGRPTGSA